MTELIIQIKNKNAAEIIDSLEKMKAIKIKRPLQKKAKRQNDKLHLLSEKSLAKDWLKKSEDIAWQNL